MEAEELLRRYDAGERDFPKTNLFGVNLSGAHFEGSCIYDGIFIESNLSGAGFFESNLRGSIFYKANLNNTIMSDSTFHGANFTRATIHNAKIRNIYFTHILHQYKQT